ncbi:uncharacterized protein LOC110038031 [Phalaenopsis equestris]|uniref:uncharacterized protein LOC110038031 n=1 Tax=Phalaenopsis equestris TaxID=78828 RepID=UPI0009E365C3|nr:uncharacterized protein LOC110038031 [Phalaenopsis equestris]
MLSAERIKMYNEIMKKKCGAKLRKYVIKTNRWQALSSAAEKRKNALAKTEQSNFSDNCDNLNEMPNKYSCRELGIFQFPWQSEPGGLAPELERYSLRDVFFSSLIDGRTAKIGFPGDRLSRPNASPIILPPGVNESIPSGVDAEEFDYIWRSILRQPLSIFCCAGTSGVQAKAFS